MLLSRAPPLVTAATHHCWAMLLLSLFAANSAVCRGVAHCSHRLLLLHRTVREALGQKHKHAVLPKTATAAALLMGHIPSCLVVPVVCSCHWFPKVSLCISVLKLLLGTAGHGMTVPSASSVTVLPARCQADR